MAGQSCGWRLARQVLAPGTGLESKRWILACKGLGCPSGIAGIAHAGYNPPFAVEQSGRIFQPIFFARMRITELFEQFKD
jgi:hypothetical protein